MADQSKLIFVNADAELEESSSTDSLQYTSFKTATYELTDSLLGGLVNAINVSTGAPDAAKYVKTDAAGKLDITFIPESSIDHGTLSGLADDDHTQYIRVDGTRAYTGSQSMGSNKVTSLADGTDPNDAVNKSQLDAAIAGLNDFRDSVIDKDLTAPPGSPTTGDRYLIGLDPNAGTATGAWAGQDGKITYYDGATWQFEVAPTSGTFLFVDDEQTAYVFNNDTFLSGLWVLFSGNQLIAGDGIDVTGNTIDVDLLASGGLKFVSTELGVEPNDFAGTGLQDDGADNLEIDFADTGSEMATSRAVAASDLSANGANQGAKILGADPATISQSTGTTIQAILEDLSDAIENDDENDYTTDGSGVTEGDVVYISANNVVTTLPITGGASNNWGIGLAKSTVGASSTVAILANDVILPGVLTGASAGAKLYWNGTTYTSTIPAGAGARVWQVGIAKNATDLHVDLRFIKRNA